ncbi:MAG: HugZ family protein [Paracoccaceae bacterium]
MASPATPVRDTDDEARELARDLIRSARTAALAVTDPATGAPFVSRIAVGTLPPGRIATLVSSLALHTRALRADPRCALLFGEPGARGDPLNHPRLSLTALARFEPAGSAGHAVLRTGWLSIHPKAKLYADFADFAFAVFQPLAGSLNGGFARAYALLPEDIRLD